MDQTLPSQGITGDQLQQLIQPVQHLTNGLKQYVPDGCTI